jgi:hypothetical protein
VRQETRRTASRLGSETYEIRQFVTERHRYANCNNGMNQVIGLRYLRVRRQTRNIPRNILGLAFKSFVHGILHRC